MAFSSRSRKVQAWSQYAALVLVYASLSHAAPSPIPETLTISFPPQPAIALAQTWPTSSGAAGDASQWSGAGGSGGSSGAGQWSGAGGAGADSSQWSGAGGAGSSSQWSGTGASSSFNYASLFTLDLIAMRIAHAALASAAMLIFFPFGGVILRLVNHRHIVWFHAGVQMFAYTIFLAAASLGIWMAKNYGVVGKYHPVIGMIVLVGMSIQPMTEILNHFFYGRYPKIVYLGYMHLWLGRVLITLGIVNGGLGFAFANTIPYQPVWSVAPKIVYAIIAASVWILYFLFCGVWQQVKYVRKMSHTSLGDEMDHLRGREGLRVEQNLEAGAGHGSQVNVGDSAQKRRVSPRPGDAGFKSSAL